MGTRALVCVSGTTDLYVYTHNGGDWFDIRTAEALREFMPVAARRRCVEASQLAVFVVRKLTDSEVTGVYIEHRPMSADRSITIDCANGEVLFKSEFDNEDERLFDSFDDFIDAAFNQELLRAVTDPTRKKILEHIGIFTD